LDLAGAEAIYSTKKFKDLFILASELSIPFTIHAGEAKGPESVYKAIEFGAKRIGHGVRAIEDMELMKLLKDKGVILEFCPTSNLNTKIYSDIKQYPIRDFLGAGVKFTINTDNMMVSNTDLEKEYKMIIETFNLTEDELRMIVNNSIEASFASKEIKSCIKQEVANVLNKM